MGRRSVGLAGVALLLFMVAEDGVRCVRVPGGFVWPPDAEADAEAGAGAPADAEAGTEADAKAGAGTSDPLEAGCTVYPWGGGAAPRRRIAFCDGGGISTCICPQEEYCYEAEQDFLVCADGGCAPVWGHGRCPPGTETLTSPSLPPGTNAGAKLGCVDGRLALFYCPDVPYSSCHYDLGLVNCGNGACYNMNNPWDDASVGASCPDAGLFDGG